MRDDFPEATKRILALRVAGRCSNPSCKAQLFGPQVDSEKGLSLGVAAHVTGASPGGPRFDPAISNSDRGSASNGIWLCQNCAKLVDNDPARFTVDLLRNWKSVAEADALASIGRPASNTIGGPEIHVKWCTLNYVEDAGIGPALRAAGYRLYWARADNVAELTDLKGWEEVVWEDPKRGPVYLRVRDSRCEYVALLLKPDK